MTGDGADVVLIGLGGAGAVAAHVLTQQGAEVLALEAGGFVGSGEARFDELENDVRLRLARPKAAGELPTFRGAPGELAKASPWPMAMGNGVGGSTTHYPGLSGRLAPWNFESRSATIARYGCSRLPAGSLLEDWPLSYDELESFYGKVEHELGVSGRPTSPYDGARTTDYPLPPLRRSGWNRLTATAARRLGWHPYPAPVALNSEAFKGRPACTYCGFCTNNVCHVDAKGSTDATLVPQALATGLLRVVTGACVSELVVDGDGTLSGVRYIANGTEQVASGRAYLLAGFVYENTRLLLLSRSAAFPQGLANGAGQVGHHYLAHLTPFVFGHFPGTRLNVWSGPWSQATCVDDWNADNHDHRDLDFVGGGMLTAGQELKPIAIASTPPPPGVPRYGSGWKSWLREAAQSLGLAVAQTECFPYEHNRLDLDPDARDPFGRPVVRVTFSPGENELRATSFLRAKLEVWLREAGADTVWSSDKPFYETRHAYGGTRMGVDPGTSVVDTYGFAHEVPNLGILGASVFPTSGGVNPTLTVQALAWRTAEYLAGQFRTATIG